MLRSLEKIGGNYLDLLDKNYNSPISFWTLQNSSTYSVPGHYLIDEDCFDIIVESPTLTEKIVKDELRALSKLTNCNYQLMPNYLVRPEKMCKNLGLPFEAKERKTLEL